MPSKVVEGAVQGEDEEGGEGEVKQQREVVVGARRGSSNGMLKLYPDRD